MSQDRSGIKSEVDDALARARAAGALGPLHYVGHGMYGIVFCDERGHAWKVFRRPEPKHNSASHELFLREALETEFEWLASARLSNMADSIVQAHSADYEQLVLERDCVPGEPGGWKDETHLADLHGQIAEAMEPLGWSAPEFKGDAYIITPEGKPVLVDAGMAMRIGTRVLEFVEDVIDGRRESYETPSTLAFYILRELPRGLVDHVAAKRVIDRLVKMDPEIAKNFSLPRADLGSADGPGLRKKREGIAVKGRRYSVDISGSRQSADVRDAAGRAFTSLNLGDMEDLLSVASNIRHGRPWEKSGRFIGDTSKEGFVIVDTKHSVRMKAMAVEDVAELVLITEEAVLEMA